MSASPTHPFDGVDAPPPEGATPAGAMSTLDAIAREMDLRSSQLAEVERRLEPVEIEYEAFVAAHEIGLWRRHESGELDGRWPSEQLRLRLALADMPPELLGRHTGLVNLRKRLEKRIGALKAAADAQRSILSALKVEAEASGFGGRRAA